MAADAIEPIRVILDPHVIAAIACIGFAIVAALVQLVIDLERK